MRIKPEIALAIDIGGSKYMVGLVDHTGHIIYSLKGSWPKLTAQAVLDTVLAACRMVLKACPGVRPSFAGITIPGLANPLAGLWVKASFSGIENLPIVDILQRELDLACYADNDGQACTLAEKMFGGGQGCKSFLYITVSNGIGGGFFTDDRLFYAASGHSVEIGHCVVVPGGRPCKCGLHGCLEMHAAGPAIVQNYLQLGGAAQIEGEAPNAKSIETLARKGDAIALQTYAEEGLLLGKMLAIAGNLLGPQKIIIGGSVSKAFGLFSPALTTALQAGLYSQASGAIQVQPSPLAEFGGLTGAAALAFARSNQLFDLQNTLQSIYGAPQHQ